MTDLKAPKGAKSPVPPLPPHVPTIDITPTWRAMLPVFLAVIENGSEQGNSEARRELSRMADIADRFVTISAHNPDAVRELLDDAAREAAIIMDRVEERMK